MLWRTCVRYRRFDPLAIGGQRRDRVEADLGRVSRYGVFELAATLDHVGTMARSARDTGAMLGVIAGSNPKDPTAVRTQCPTIRQS